MASVPVHQAQARHTLEWAVTVYRKRIVLACSFGGPSGMVLVDLLHEIDPSVPVYYLDTGLLFPETYELVERVRQRYGIEPVAVAPELNVSEQAAAYGEALWSRDPDLCCDLRKVRPQRKFLTKYSAWITGLRRDQSGDRGDIKAVEWDPQFSGQVKINPLAAWSEAECWDYIRAHDVPYNPLHDAAYPSLGCVPCTRSVRKGEGARAGRWPGFEKTECGLHVARPASDAQR
jgi:phosphoadenosine phosphosulfate reductase